MPTLQHNNNWDLTLGDANVIIDVKCVNGLGFTSHVNVKINRWIKIYVVM